MLSRSVVSDSVQLHGLSLTRLLCLWDFSGKNAEVGCHLLLQGIFLTQGSNLYLLHWKVESLPLSYLGRALKSSNMFLGTRSLCVCLSLRACLEKIKKALTYFEVPCEQEIKVKEEL